MSHGDEHRRTSRQARDDAIAAEPKLPDPTLPTGAQPVAVEHFLDQHRAHPVAVAGVVENGVVRPLDPQVKLQERSRVIIVTSEPD